MVLINNRVLMSDAKNFSNEEPINPYYKQQTINHGGATQDHDLIKQCLIDAGIEVVTTDSPDGCQDGVYTANWALVRGDKAILSSLPAVRKDEEDYAAKVLEELGKTVIRQRPGLKFSGQGDALACGNYLLCGKGYRSDEEAQLFAADQLGYEYVQLETIPLLDQSGTPVTNVSSHWPDSFFYDIDLAIAIIKAPDEKSPGVIAYCPEAFTSDSCQKIEALDNIIKIVITIQEAQDGFAANLISTGQTVIMSQHAPLLKNELEKLGFKVLTPAINELSKGGGYIRCVALTLD